MDSVHRFIPVPWYTSPFMTHSCSEKNVQQHTQKRSVGEFCCFEHLGISSNLSNSQEVNRSDTQPFDATCVVHIGHQWEEQLHTMQQTLREQEHMLQCAKRVNASLHTQILHKNKNIEGISQVSLRDLCLQKTN